MTVPRLVRSSPALRDRLLLGWEREAAALAAAVTEDEYDLDRRRWSCARSCGRTGSCSGRRCGRLLEGEDPAERRARPARPGARVYARLDLGLAGYGGLMYRLTFTGDEDLLDVVLPLLPGGVHDDGDAYVAYSAAPFSEAVARPRPGGVVDEVPADWKLRADGRRAS